MLWYVFVWFYLITDHAPWWVYLLAGAATSYDYAKERMTP